jgi:hypothetical protein
MKIQYSAHKNHQLTCAYFEPNKSILHQTSCIFIFSLIFSFCLCGCGHANHLRMATPISMGLGIYIILPVPISAAYFINLFHPSVSIRVSLNVARQRLGKKNPLIIARQRHGKKFTAATNKHTIIEELLEASFTMRPILCQGI